MLLLLLGGCGPGLLGLWTLTEWTVTPDGGDPVTTGDAGWLEIHSQPDFARHLLRYRYDAPSADFVPDSTPEIGTSAYDEFADAEDVVLTMTVDPDVGTRYALMVGEDEGSARVLYAQGAWDERTGLVYDVEFLLEKR